jgi:hypothetical protein
MRSLCLLLLSAWTAGALPVAAQTMPDNPHGSFRADCRICHDAESWTPATIGPEFDHARFGFPLDDAHKNVPCLLCHLTLEFDTATGTTCAGCHDDVHLGELGSDCERCHTTRNFVDRADEVRSHRATRFPLTGVHLTLDCAACHESGGATLRFVNTPVECEACHRDDYARTTNPDHVAASFPTDCAQCHSPYSWGGSAFNHALTGFPLTGAHLGMDCRECHAGFAFAGTPSACVGCHRAEYDAATQPAHVAAGFPTECASCHSTNAWQPATFDHSLTAFPLTGAHAALDCRSCHDDGVYSGRDPACVACHLADYQATTNPGHLQSGFGTDCASCHGTSQWEGATFDHDALWFPIYSGRHRNEWNTCADCHGNPNDFSVFSCLGCHPHSDRASTDEKHREENGYVYESSACLACHPQGTH